MSEGRKHLLGCLDGLPASQRAVFLMHHEDGLTLDELARALELGFETAKSRLRYAMAKLRACMGAYLPLDRAVAAAGVAERWPASAPAAGGGSAA